MAAIRTPTLWMASLGLATDMEFAALDVNALFCNAA
jgi:hypothetical protein